MVTITRDLLDAESYLREKFSLSRFDVPVIFTPEFMEKNTIDKSIYSLFYYGGIKVYKYDDMLLLGRDAVDSIVRKRTDFGSFDNMLRAAVNDFMHPNNVPFFRILDDRRYKRNIVQHDEE